MLAYSHARASRVAKYDSDSVLLKRVDAEHERVVHFDVRVWTVVEHLAFARLLDENNWIQHIFVLAIKYVF